LKIDRYGRDDLPQRFPLRTGRFTAAEVTIYRRGGDDLPQRFPLRKKTIHRSASNGLRRSASAASFPAGTMTHPPYPKLTYRVNPKLG